MTEQNQIERVVIKLGSDIVAAPSGRIKRNTIRRVADSVVQLQELGHFAHIVSSGAVAAGRRQISDHKFRAMEAEGLPALQVLAAIGQPQLTDQFNRAVTMTAARSTQVAQVLVTQQNFANQTELQNLKRLFDTIENIGAIALVNENDSVATEEFLTDNDVIAGQVARLICATQLILVSSVGGFKDENGATVSQIGIDQHEYYRGFIQSHDSSRGRGGMVSKFSVACQAATSGINTYIIGEEDIDEIPKIFESPLGTHFLPELSEFSSGTDL